MFQDGKIPSRMANGGVPKFPPHPCELAASTSDDHNFLVRTSICTFLDSTKSSFSIEFYKMNFSAQTWAEHWDGSQTVKEWSVLVSGTSVLGTNLYLKCLGLCLA